MKKNESPASPGRASEEIVRRLRAQLDELDPEVLTLVESVVGQVSDWIVAETSLQHALRELDPLLDAREHLAAASRTAPGDRPLDEELRKLAALRRERTALLGAAVGEMTRDDQARPTDRPTVRGGEARPPDDARIPVEAADDPALIAEVEEVDQAERYFYRRSQPLTAVHEFCSLRMVQAGRPIALRELLQALDSSGLRAQIPGNHSAGNLVNHLVRESDGRPDEFFRTGRGFYFSFSALREQVKKYLRGHFEGYLLELVDNPREDVDSDYRWVQDSPREGIPLHWIEDHLRRQRLLPLESGWLQEHSWSLIGDGIIAVDPDQYSLGHYDGVVPRPLYFPPTSGPSDPTRPVNLLEELLEEPLPAPPEASDGDTSSGGEGG